MNFENRLKGQKAVVVGGGTGMGASLARALDEAGVQVVIGGRRLSALQETAQGTQISSLMVDVADRASVDQFFSQAAKQLGQVDILVIAAGTNIKNRSMAEMEPDQWDQLMAINATGAYNCMHAVLPAMRQRKSGTILNISSVAGKRAIALGGIAYSASKFAMTALGTCVSNEVAPDGVRVINLYPGEVNTPILENRPTPVTEEHKQRILQPEHVTELIMSVLNLPESVHVPELVIKPLTQNWY
ncbi:MAG: SDR family NAD(P)-dependent oxidoreductase [Pirellulales bacterium]